MAAGTSSYSSIFSLKNSRPPDDTVFYSIYPDSCLSSSSAEDLHSLHLQILNYVQPLTAPYIWQHQPFSLSITPAPVPHLSGHLCFGDNLEDEWFVVHILFEISKRFPNLSIRVWDSDGEFLLIECAFHLPKWLNPETSTNRVFLRSGRLHILPPSIFQETPNLEDALRLLASQDGKDSSTSAPDAVQLHLNKKIGEYPERAYGNVHKVRVLVPVSVAWLLRHEPCLISLSVEGFYDRDIDSMKYAARMERLLPRGKQEEMVEVVVRMSRTMYAQLVQQKFQAPACYPMPERSNVAKYLEAELGMKIACGFEMMYQMRKKQGAEGKGSTWEAFRDSLERSGYFKGLLPGSNKYKTLLEKAEGYYQNSSLYSRARNLKDVDLDVDQFMKDMESVMGLRGSDKNDSDIDLEEGSSSDLDFDDDYEEGSEHADDIDEDGENEFMHSYSDALNKELKATTLDKTFVHANEETSKKKDEGTSNVDDEMEELTPVDVDFNLVKNFLESYSSQEGLSGPASNLLGLMGLRLPDDVGKGK
ncbi:protein ecdysoneless homolog isoform X2 [Salvia splendens]|uniref:protein ecdysoneless homolog isoform X2 n=1 Tax=Salvia splendens TaxID=180675 RepID=UPI001C25BDD0|nr:protein ecdysoneless homolog isoform X2 [Salvia splendens]